MKGIIMGAESVRAILQGKKHQTRRVVKPQPKHWRCQVPGMQDVGGLEWKGVCYEADSREDIETVCPFGKPGDVLYVKEGYFETSWHDVIYRADSDEDAEEFRREGGWPWKSPLVMPEWASRLHVRLTNVRVERLQDITEEDVIAEGLDVDYLEKDFKAWCEQTGNDYERGAGRGWYAEIWNRLNAKRGYPWESNPWVWVLTFEKVEV